MNKMSFLISALSLIISGCTFYNVNGEAIHLKPGRDKSPHEIQYLETVHVPYDVVGHVSVYTERRNSMDDIADKMKRQAAILGGDAIINITPVESGRGWTTIRTTFTGTVIVFKDALPNGQQPTTSLSGNAENLK